MSFTWTHSPSKAHAASSRLRLETLEDRCVPSADSILDWNAVLLQANATDHARATPEQGGPILTARAFALVSAAMYDAYNSIESIGTPYLVSAPNSREANSDAAVAQAAYETLAALFPSQRAAFHRALVQSLSDIRDGLAEVRGRAVGAYVANQILAARSADGAALIGTPAYVASGLPGFHDVDPLHPSQGFYAPGAANITPFAVESVDQFEARRLDDGTPAGRLAFLASQEYTDAYNEVLALGSDSVSAPTQRTAEQTQIGIYWGYDGRPGLGTPPRMYNQIARVIAAQEGNTEAENARLFALLNLAMADAGLTSWNNKYDDAFWRPVLAVRNGATDGNAATVGDSDWTPQGAPASNPRPGDTNFTPPFPAYTSGHATFGAAVFQTLARFYGTDDIEFSFVSDELNGVTRDANGTRRPLVPRTFDSLTEAKIENAQSRIYLGIHWRFDADDGILTGDAVADYVFDNLLRPASTYRSIDGTGNNLAHPEWGSTDEQLVRVAPAEYGDGISTPAGADRPGAREISNALATHIDEATPNDRDMTAFIYVWGQFLDHDLDLTKSASPVARLDISVPSGDAFFDPTGTGSQIIPLLRSVFDTTTGTSASNPRQQINQITAWIDGSMIYGSDADRAAVLRSLSGGRLRVMSATVGDLPPLNTLGLPNANDAHRVSDDQLFLAGDIRSNENIELTSMHTLFLREHNRLADQIAAANPGLSDEEIYQRARQLVIAEIQAITYNEWLPALLGTNALATYRGYDSSVNPGIANEFSTAAFRLHSTINDDVEFFDNEGRPITFTYINERGETVEVEGEIALFEAFSNPTLFRQTGVDGILKYAASTHAEELDNQMVESLRNFLFGPPGAGGLDLASLNIQRGRDHGLADYNTVRAAYGLPRVTSFAQITSDTSLQAKLQTLYGSVDNIDLWVGGLAEDHVGGGSTGPTIRAILLDQFARLRDGDRFWSENVFSGKQLTQLRRTSLADVIERNTGVTGLQDNVFLFQAEVSGQVFADRNGNGRQDHGEQGISGVTLEILNDEGDVVGTAVTDHKGKYRFTDFHETGDFQVRVVAPDGTMVTTANPCDAHISTGDVALRNVDFGLRSGGGLRAAPGSARISQPAATASDFADIVALLARMEGDKRLA